MNMKLIFSVRKNRWEIVSPTGTIISIHPSFVDEYGRGDPYASKLRAWARAQGVTHRI